MLLHHRRNRRHIVSLPFPDILEPGRMKFSLPLFPSWIKEFDILTFQANTVPAILLRDLFAGAA